MLDNAEHVVEAVAVVAAGIVAAVPNAYVWAPVIPCLAPSTVVAPSIVRLSTYRLRSSAAEPPHPSFRKFTVTVCSVEAAQVPRKVKSWCWLPLCGACAIITPPIWTPSIETVNCASP